MYILSIVSLYFLLGWQKLVKLCNRVFPVTTLLSLAFTPNLVPRVSRARRDPGRVWSRASVTIENTREGSSLNKEFVALMWP